ncbi:MAG: aldehyde ferredoxin oxidoreductase family protein [Chloroflexota bacterium]
MRGVHGRWLHVRLPGADAALLPIPPETMAAVIGGAGLAARLLLDLCPPGADPLGPENPLVLASSPFAGTSLTTSAKIAYAARSPQTGMIGDSLSSSWLALALKGSGADAIAVTGACAAWSVLVVDDDAVRLEPAADLLGRDPAATADALRARLGAGFRVAAIGLAGENGVRFASIANDGRLAGRTGTGAVMGSKRLKAIAIRGSALPPVADARGLAVAARDLARRSLGPETAKYRELGTAANLAFFSRIGILPTRNFAERSFPGADAISGERLFAERHASRHACAACTIGCEHHYRYRDGDGDGGGDDRDGGQSHSGRLEYETLFALGSLCGIDDPDAILAAAACDRLGMDAISTGGTIAWAMECRACGVDLSPFGGPAPGFGDMSSMLPLIHDIAARRGLGALLADGSRAAADTVGQGSAAWAMHVKGLELPGYHPAALPATALGLAVAARGACHNRSGAYQADLSDALGPAAAADAIAAAAIASEDQAALLDSLTLCKFLRHAFHDLPVEAAALYRLVTGLEMSGDDLLRSAAGIVHGRRQFNERMGWTPALDTLPARLLDGEHGLGRDTLARLVGAYERHRGWSAG